MSLVKITQQQTTPALPAGSRYAFDVGALRSALTAEIQGEVRFDPLSRALYSTDASVYQIEPLGVVIPKSREDVVKAVRICGRFRCPITMRGGGTSQAGQAIGEGIQIDISKYLNQVLEVNAQERWARVQPGVVLDELNAVLKPHGLRFAPDVSTASRATIGGMMANNSSGARSVLYGKTIDHVLEQEVILSDGSIAQFRPLSQKELESVAAGDSLEARCYREVRRIAMEHAGEIEARFPKVLRRVGGYNLDEFTRADRPFNLAKLMVGSEGTLGVVLEAKLSLVELPKAKAVLAIQFEELREALQATPLILRHGPSAVEVMDSFILDNTKQNADLDRLRKTFIEGDPGALLCVEFYADSAAELPPRMSAVEQDLRANGFGSRFFHAPDAAAQSRIWGLREAALGLSMAMKDDAKSLSFVEDTAVAPERLAEYIARFQAIIRNHRTTAGIYAHASVGCLHVRPVVNMKTEEGVREFEAIANEISDLVLEFGGALSGEHGDGLVRSPFMSKMFGPMIYEAFRSVKRVFDPDGIFNPGKIVDAPPLTANLRYGPTYRVARAEGYFDYSEFGGNGIAGAVEMCSGLGVCRKKLEGTMCPSYMATREEQHSTRGRANALRLVLSGKLGEQGLDNHAAKDVLDLCLECRACKVECPVGVDVARFKSEFLAGYWQRHGTPLRTRFLGRVRETARWGSRLAPISNWAGRSGVGRVLAEKVLGIDRRRNPPAFAGRTFVKRHEALRATADSDVWLFADTFTNYFHPGIGTAGVELLQAGGLRVGVAPDVCCGRPLLSQGLLGEAREQARRAVEALAGVGKPLLFLEPSCLSAMREDVPALLRGDLQKRARAVAENCYLFEDWLNRRLDSGEVTLSFKEGPKTVLFHGHCHQKAMGMTGSAKALLGRLPRVSVVDLDAGCCGMAGSFGYAKERFELSRSIGERRLLPAARGLDAGSVLVASGTSCRQQVEDFAGGARAVHAVELLRDLLQTGGGQ